MPNAKPSQNPAQNVQMGSLKPSLVGLLLYVPFNSYGHVRMVSSPNHTFFLGTLDQAFNQYFVNIYYAQ